MKLVLATCVTLALVAAATADDKVSVKVVKYDGLTDVIKQGRGKVVVVDFWADFCIPCKREFPKLVALHARHAKDGLLAVAVSLDDLGDEGAQAKVQKFLESRKATLTNLILDEKPEVWQAKLGVAGPPLVYVFNRQGKLEQKFTDEGVDYAKIEALVAELLKK